MANCQKYTRAACGHLFKHYERAKDENGEYVKFGNQDIDASRTHLNYNLAPKQMNGQGGFIKERCSEVKMQNRKDVNVMCSWVVTAPKELKEDETERFFRETYKFLSERYGRDNVVSAYVHMDEITPHIHFAFVPVVRDKKKNTLKVSAKEAIDRLELQRFHKDLSGYMENIFGRDVGILNEATKEGNKSIDELKRGTAQRELAEIKNQADELLKQQEKQSREIQAANNRIKSLKKEEKDLEKQITELEKDFASKELTAADLAKIKPIKGFFGGVKNIKYDDVVNLRGMTMTTLQEKKALNGARQTVERLKGEKAELTKENAELKKKVPTTAQQMEQNKRIIKIQDLEKENKRLWNIIQRLTAGAEQLPERERKIIMNIIEPPRDERRRSRDDWER
jgi:peptidoglycan hydrolase CwlO-like protein